MISLPVATARFLGAYHKLTHTCQWLKKILHARIHGIRRLRMNMQQRLLICCCFLFSNMLRANYMHLVIGVKLTARNNNEASIFNHIFFSFFFLVEQVLFMSKNFSSRFSSQVTQNGIKRTVNMFRKWVVEHGLFFFDIFMSGYSKCSKMSVKVTWNQMSRCKWYLDQKSLEKSLQKRFWRKKIP